MEFLWVRQLKKLESSLTRTEQELISYINQNPEHVSTATLKELTELSGVSKPVIINCYKKLEYVDYRSFQGAVEQFFSSQIDSLKASKQMKKRVKSVDQLIQESAEVDIRALERLQNIITTDDLKNICKKIGESKSIYVMGEGTGYYPAHYLSQRLRRYGIRALFIDQDSRHIPDMLHPGQEGDTIILFHYSDKNEWLWPILRLAKAKSMNTMLFSGIIHPDYVREVTSFYHIPRGEMNFKNSMAVPMHFANQILLSYELIHSKVVETHLTDLEQSRIIWDREDLSGINL